MAGALGRNGASSAIAHSADLSVPVLARVCQWKIPTILGAQLSARKWGRRHAGCSLAMILVRSLEAELFVLVRSVHMKISTAVVSAERAALALSSNSSKEQGGVQRCRRSRWQPMATPKSVNLLPLRCTVIANRQTCNLLSN